MKNLYNNLAILVLLFLPFILQAQNAKSVLAKIEIERTDNSIHVLAYAENKTDSNQEQLNYALLSIKDSPDNNFSKNQQSGIFSLLPNETKLLSKQSFNKDEKISLSVNLSINNGSDEIAMDVVQIGENSNNTNQKSTSQISIGTSKVQIIKNTRTKHGKYFSVFFNEINKEDKTIFLSDVIISEKINSSNRSTEISVHSNNQLIYKFRTIAKKDYLYAAAQETIKRLKKFYLNGSESLLADKSQY